MKLGEKVSIGIGSGSGCEAAIRPHGLVRPRPGQPRPAKASKGRPRAAGRQNFGCNNPKRL